MARLTDDADYDAGETSENVSSPRMAKLTDDADYDAGETFENVSSPQSDARNQDNYYGRRLRTRCVLHSLLGCCKLPTTMPAKRLRMYQVHCQMLGIKTTMADDFRLGAFYIVSLNTRPSCGNESVIVIELEIEYYPSIGLLSEQFLFERPIIANHFNVQERKPLTFLCSHRELNFFINLLLYLPEGRFQGFAYHAKSVPVYQISEDGENVEKETWLNDNDMFAKDEILAAVFSARRLGPSKSESETPSFAYQKQR
ncbi:unnamed protein product [Protopolystoma xenopodis]|uniref:Uncharacterized protein n=1 Tax=Protopolystoma xenopodis TaxID=117903 RepID=A0A448XK84_9PLAT|nr:unnamed protein product [Protopolystoma xenopodis]